MLDALEARLTEGGLPETLVLEMRLLAEEALTNVVKYAAAQKVSLAVELAAGEVALEFRDDGRAFDPLTAPAPVLDERLEGRPLGGLGIHLIQSLADDVRYTRDGVSNVLRVAKKL